MVAASVPAGYTLRAMRVEDKDAAVAVEEASEVATDGMPDPAMMDGVQLTWSQPGFDPGRDAWVVVAPDGQVVGFAHLGPVDRHHLYSHGYVHPEHTGRGIGSLLVSLIDARAEQRLSSTGDGDDSAGRVTLQQWLSARNPAAHALFRQHGYAVVRHMWGMTIDMPEEPEAPIWPDGVIVRSCDGEDDLRMCHSVMEDAFRDHWQHEPQTFDQFKTRMVDVPTFDPSLWFIAFNGTMPIGTAQCELLPDRGWITTVGVLRRWRGQGIALALLRHAFDEFYRRGMRRAGLGVDSQNPTGATRVYERAGMRVERQYDVYEKVLRGGD